MVLESCHLEAEQAAALHADLSAGQWVKLSVIDNGCGMDAGVLEHIFEPFFTTKAPGAGTGLGLAVVHGIMQSHQGAVVVQSKAGVGSTFDLYFPPQAMEAEPSGAKPNELKLGRGERILVVDDDAISGFTIEKLIETLNYEVRRFVRPEEALAHFTEDPNRYDLVVTDLAMPVMNGAELMAHLLKIRPAVPILVITGYIEPARAQLLEGSAVRAVLHKPVSREDLAAAIATNLPPPLPAE